MRTQEYQEYMDEENPKWMKLLPRILFIIAATLALILVLGTIIAYITKKDSIGDSYRKADPTPQKVMNMSRRDDEKVSAYTEIGELRLMTMADESDPYSQGTFLILTPWFSYPEGDTVFYEELSQKDRQIKSIISEYFAGYTETQLRSMGELAIKEQLKELINSQLVLGQIRNIYFEEYIFFE